MNAHVARPSQNQMRITTACGPPAAKRLSNVPLAESESQGANPFSLPAKDWASGALSIALSNKRA